MLCALSGLSPKLLRGEAGAFGEAAQFGPGEVGMDPAAEAAIGAGDDVPKLQFSGGLPNEEIKIDDDSNRIAP